MNSKPTLAERDPAVRSQPRRLVRALAALSLALMLAGCAPAQPARTGLSVVATYSILGDWVRQVGGDRVSVVVLVGPGGDAHTYEPVPGDSAALVRAAVIFENGLGFESWLDKLIASSRSEARRVVVSRNLAPRRIVDSNGQDETDPHIWHDPRHAMKMVQEIRDALAEADPANADEYRRRAADYEKQLQELDRWIADEVATLPAGRRVLVTTHDTFGYFAERYGFTLSSVIGSVSSEATDPSAAEIAATVERVRSAGVPAIFAENILNPRLTRQVAEEAGVKLAPTLYTDALGPPGSEGESYLGMMRFNVRTMVEALR